MSIIHLDGFDSYATSADLPMEYTAQSAGLTTSGGRFGGGAVVLSSLQSSCARAVASTTELWFGGAVYLTTVGSNTFYDLFFVSSNAGVEGSIAFNGATGAIAAYRGANNTQLGVSPSGAISQSAWHWVEARWRLSATVGQVEVWVDNVQVMTLSNVNTTQNAQTTFDVVGVGQANSTLGTITYYLDDFYILDPSTTPNNTRLGDSRIATLLPVSDAGPNNGTPSTAGAHFAMVDEAQYDTGTYLTIVNTSGQEELFGFGALGDTPTNVWAVKVLGVAEKTDAGASSLTPVLVSGGTVADGAAQPLNTAWAMVSSIYQVDPHTAGAWTPASVNAISAGVQVP